ncbi:MAG TPA: SNF2-related protein [Calditerricola sp.]
MTVAAQKVAKGARVKVTMPLWLMRERGLASCELEGTVEVVTGRAILVSGSAVVTPSSTCRRCRREITNPVSVLVGFGPYCSEELGIPRDFSPEQVEEIRRMLQAKTHVRVWLPLAKVEVEIVEQAPQQAPPAAPRRPVAEVSVRGGRLYVRAPFGRKDALKAVAGARWSPEARAWTYPATVEIMRQVRRVLDGLAPVQYDEAAEKLLQDAERAEQAAAAKTAAQLPPIPITKTEPWPHQQRAFWFAHDLRAAMLAAEMGTGKSRVVVDLVVNREHDTTLILAPLSVVGVWPREFRKHAGRPVEVLPLNEGSLDRRTKLAADFLERCKQAGLPAVVVINYEAAWREPFRSFALGRRWSLVVLDESHRIKAPGGRQSRFCSELRDRADYRLCLTGTPMPHSPLDIYAQYRFLDPGIFGSSYERFKRRYAVMGGYGGKQVVAYQRLDELHERMYQIAFRITKEEAIALPEAVHIERTVQLGAKGLRAYQNMERDFYADVEDGKITASNALARLLRLQQITSGFLPNAEGEGVTRIDEAKQEALEDVLADIPEGEPVVVFTRFVHDLDVVRAVAEKLGRRYGELSGRRNDLTPDATMPEWAQVFGVQIQAGGVGVDLTRASYAVYYSLGFSLGDYEQSLARVHRPGQQRMVRYIHLIAEGTVDEKVYAALRARKNVVESVLAERSQKGGENH